MGLWKRMKIWEIPDYGIFFEKSVCNLSIVPEISFHHAVRMDSNSISINKECNKFVLVLLHSFFMGLCFVSFWSFDKIIFDIQST